MSSLHYGGQQANRRALVILIIGLAVVALVYAAARTGSHPHAVRPPDPVAPLVGAVDRAKAVAGAANDRTDQLNGQTGSASSGEVNPFGP